ncbi:hypothetical protein M1D72_10140 [Vibrio sp. AK197]
MFKLATVIFTAAVSTTFAAGALASDLDIQQDATATDSMATFTVTKDGEPLANYPVQVECFVTSSATTAEDGTIRVTPNVYGTKQVTLSVDDNQGQKVTETAFISVPRN